VSFLSPWSLAVACTLVLGQAFIGTHAHSAELKPTEEAAQAFEQAMQALKQGQQEQAELLLERVLMLSPENAEARLELAGLFAKRGRVLSAKLMLESLESDPRTPTEHKQQLRKLIAELSGAMNANANANINANSNSNASANLNASNSLQTLQASTLTSKQVAQTANTQIEFGLTQSSNPLARTASEGITFTLPEGPVQLPLSVKPIKALARTFQLSHEPLEFQNAGVEIYLQSLESGVAQSQTAVRLSAWGSIQTNGQHDYGLQLPNPLQWHYQAQQGLDGLRRQSFSLAYPFDCAGLAWRGVAVHYQEPTTVERQGDRGHALRLEQKGMVGALTWLLHTERSSSQVFEQGYVRAGLFAEVVPLPNLLPQMRLTAQLSDQRDTHSYSPLLLNGAKRQLISSLVAIEQQAKLEKEKVLIFRAFSAERRSNLELFNYKDVGVQVLLRANL